MLQAWITKSAPEVGHVAAVEQAVDINFSAPCAASSRAPKVRVMAVTLPPSDISPIRCRAESWSIADCTAPVRAGFFKKFAVNDGFGDARQLLITGLRQYWCGRPRSCPSDRRADRHPGRRRRYTSSGDSAINLSSRGVFRRGDGSAHSPDGLWPKPSIMHKTGAFHVDGSSSM